jgi:hypothetical protein
MRHVKIVCDRCGAIVLDQGSMIELTAGHLRHRLPKALDLCSTCTGLFADFIKSGHQASHVAPGTGIPTQLDQLAIQRAGSV